MLSFRQLGYRMRNALLILLVTFASMVSSSNADAEIHYRDGRPGAISQQDQQHLLIFEAFLQALLDADVDRWVELWDEDALFEIPYAPDGYPKNVRGKQEIAKYIANFPEEIRYKEFKNIEIFFVKNKPNVMVVDFSADTVLLKNNLVYTPRYVSLIWFSDDKISEYRDFWDPLQAQDAFGGLEDLLNVQRDSIVQD